MPTQPHRLPKDVLPRNYIVEIEPDLDQETFEGKVQITCDIAAATDVIKLNSDGLEIKDLTIKAGGQNIECNYTFEESRQQINIQLVNGSLQKNTQLKLLITYSGKFHPRLVGPYISKYTDEAGQVHKIASTQFEAPHARKCFPCWDEPEFKAIFQMKLIIPTHLQAVSNTPVIESKEISDEKTQITFDETIPLSSYLVAFVIGDIVSTPEFDTNGTKLKVWHTPGKEHLTDFAVKVAKFALSYLTEYFGVQYSGQKIDLIALPDFELGAMENQGCITFRESALLVDESKATQSELQRAADVIAHELAHMWFGNLVTMKWWNGLWLNEAFASFMEMKTTEAFKPEWLRWVDFGLSRSAAFAVDATPSTRPIEYEVHTPEDAEGMFDVLTYEKGASLVRMLEQYMGENLFKEGIVEYINKHSYSNAETSDLWSAIGDKSDKPIQSTMESWVFQGGFPTLEISLKENVLSVRQNRTQYLGCQYEDEDTEWLVPINYRYQANGIVTNEKILLDKKEIEINISEQPDWTLFNSHGNGFYKVHYPQELMEQLLANKNIFSPVERYNLVDDLWSAVLSGRQSVSYFLTALESFSSEEDRSVWQRVISGFASIEHLTSGEAKDNLKRIVRETLNTPITKIGLAVRDDDDDLTKQLRSDLIVAMGTLGSDPEIQTEAQRTVSMGIRNPELVDPNVFKAAVQVVAYLGDTADFEEFTQQFLQAKNPQDELTFLSALATFSDESCIKQLHEMILNQKIRTQTSPFLLAKALTSQETSQETWHFIVANWDKLYEMFGDNLTVRMLSGVTKLDNFDPIESVTNFLKRIKLKASQATLEQYRERLDIQLALRSREADKLTQFLNNVI